MDDDCFWEYLGNFRWDQCRRTPLKSLPPPWLLRHEDFVPIPPREIVIQTLSKENPRPGILPGELYAEIELAKFVLTKCYDQRFFDMVTVDLVVNQWNGLFIEARRAEIKGNTPNPEIILEQKIVFYENLSEVKNYPPRCGDFFVISSLVLREGCWYIYCCDEIKSCHEPPIGYSAYIESGRRHILNNATDEEIFENINKKYPELIKKLRN